MKKLSMVLALCMLSVILFASGPSRMHASAVVTVHTAIDPVTREVAISGTISSGEGKMVTVKVTDPAGGIDYINQAVSGKSGSYSFAYKPNAELDGEYRVAVGGDGVAVPVQASFRFEEPEEQSPGSGPGSGTGQTPGSGMEPTDPSDAQTVLEDELTASVDGNVQIDLQKDKQELLLPVDAGKLLGDNRSLVARSEAATIIIPSKVLRALQSFAGEKADADAQISIVMRPMAAELAKPLLEKETSSGGVLRAPGGLMQFELAIVTKDGARLTMPAFDEPVEIVLPYRGEGIRERLLGIYYYDESGALWTYIGGEVDRANRQIHAKSYHFSIYAAFEYHKPYEDLAASHWSYDAVQVLSAKQIVVGQSERSFAPDKAVTRAEFVAMLARAFQLQASGPAPFTDVAEGQWYAQPIAAAVQAGWVKGRTNALFVPNAAITREEMATVLVQAYEQKAGHPLTTDGVAPFKDGKDISGWAMPFVIKARAAGLMNGTGDNAFHPAAATTRAEAAQAIYNFMSQS